MTAPTRLKVPSVEETPGPFAERSGTEVAAWLEELPLGNPETAAALVLDALHRTNRGPLHQMSRFEFAERLRPQINGLAEALQKQYRGAELPLSANHEHHAELVARLYRELAVGFRHSVNYWIERAPKRRDQRNQALLAFQRAILAQGRALLEAYRVYTPEPQGFWRILHTLYANAERLQLQAQPIEGVPDSDETALAIRQAYLRIVILALANPYHLMQGEAEELYRRIGRWVHFARIAAPASANQLGGSFMLDLDSDLPPRYVSAQKGLRIPTSEPRVLELDALVNTLDQQIGLLAGTLQRSRHGNTLSERQQYNMYQRFYQALGGRQERKEERRARMAGLRLVGGLSQCHFVLNGRQPFHPEQDEQRWNQRIAEVSRGSQLELVRDDTLDRGGRMNHNARFQGFDAEADDIWGRANRVAPQDEETDEEFGPEDGDAAHILQRKNESEGGLALFQPHNSPLRTRVGALVAFQDPDTEEGAEHWRIGAVRWMRTHPQRGIEVGIEFIADSAYAGASKASSGPGAGSDYMRTLVVPRVNPILRPATLITPSGVYAEGTRLSLNLGELVLQVQLTEMLESTPLYSHFRFRNIPAGESTR